MRSTGCGMARRPHGLALQLALLVLLSSFLLAAAGRPRRAAAHAGPPPIPTGEPTVCVCQNASQPLDVDSVRWAVKKALSRSPLLTFDIQWDDLALKDEAAGPSDNNLGSCGGNTSAGPSPQPEQVQLAQCLNDNHVPAGVSWATAMQDDMNTLKVVGTWWTAYPREVLLTLVTTSTSDRLNQLEAQCKTWPGPLSVALFIGLYQEDATGPLNAENVAVLREAVVQVGRSALRTQNAPYPMPAHMLQTHGTDPGVNWARRPCQHPLRSCRRCRAARACTANAAVHATESSCYCLACHAASELGRSHCACGSRVPCRFPILRPTWPPPPVTASPTSCSLTRFTQRRRPSCCSPSTCCATTRACRCGWGQQIGAATSAHAMDLVWLSQSLSRM